MSNAQLHFKLTAGNKGRAREHSLLFVYGYFIENGGRNVCMFVTNLRPIFKYLLQGAVSFMQPERSHSLYQILGLVFHIKQLIGKIFCFFRTISLKFHVLLSLPLLICSLLSKI